MDQRGTERVADILEQHLDATIHNWLGSVEEDQDLIRIPLNFKERTRHLPRLLHDVIARLRRGAKSSISIAAGHHGKMRKEQGYSVMMLVDESRFLQMSIFSTLNRNETRLKSSKLLSDVVIIAG